MGKPRKMDSRELGLLLGQQFLGVEDLHYGLWEPDLELTLANLPRAQQRYTDRLLSLLPPPESAGRIIDIGCGTGHLLAQMLRRGYHADAVVPCPELAQRVRERLADLPGHDTRLFERRCEDFPAAELAGHYGVAIFSESFQYIPLERAFAVLEQILAPGGLLVICDFFKTEHHGDGLPGDRSFGGGHDLAAFYAEIGRRPFTVLHDEDITALVSPNLRLLNELLLGKIGPAARSIGEYLQGRYPLVYRLGRRLLRRRLERIEYKYFSGHRSPEVFERYKNYRRMAWCYTPRS